MKRILLALALCSSLDSAVISADDAVPAKPARVEWEYKKISKELGEIELNKLGAEGWELVTVAFVGEHTAGNGGNYQPHVSTYLKRPKAK